ncbi:arylamine N-acetyltransferase [Streptomyces sp. NPDC000880]
MAVTATSRTPCLPPCWSATHPQSRFVGQVVAQQSGPQVRRALVRGELTVLRPDGTSERRRIAAGEMTSVLEEVFGIELDAGDSAELVRVHSAGA